MTSPYVKVICGAAVCAVWACRTKTVTLDETCKAVQWHVAQSVYGALLADTLVITNYHLTDTDTVAVTKSTLVRHAVVKSTASVCDTVAGHHKLQQKKISTAVPSPAVSVETIQAAGNLFFRVTSTFFVLAIVVYVALKLRILVKNRS